MTKKQHVFWFWAQLICTLVNLADLWLFTHTGHGWWAAYCCVAGSFCLTLTIRHYLALRNWCNECDDERCWQDGDDEDDTDEDDGF